MTIARGRRSRSGTTLIEVTVALLILGLGVMSLLSAASLGLRQTTRARDDIQYWADIQQVIDSLKARGWNNVSAGSVTIRGRAVSWTVGAAGSNPQLITLVGHHYTYMQPRSVLADTVIVYLPNRAEWAF